MFTLLQNQLTNFEILIECEFRFVNVWSEIVKVALPYLFWGKFWNFNAYLFPFLADIVDQIYDQIIILFFPSFFRIHEDSPVSTVTHA